MSLERFHNLASREPGLAETVILPASESTKQGEEFATDPEATPEQQRHVTLNATLPLDGGQEIVKFTLCQPTFVPERTKA